MSLFDNAPADDNDRLNVQDFMDGMPVEGFYVLAEVSLRDTKRGTQYIRVMLRDASGSVGGNLWDTTEAHYSDVAEQYADLRGAQFVKIRGMVESYRDQLQVKLTRLRPADPSEVNLGELVAETPFNRGDLAAEMRGHIDAIKDEDLSALVHLIFDDAEFFARFCNAPAARGNHHAYVGGLLEHTVSVARICGMYAAANPTLRADLLKAGALFHDLGKVEEMTAGVTVEYTDEGSLLGHLIQGVLYLEKRLTELPDFPREKRNLIFHLILSHHGRFEYGSPVLPAIPEAFALHHIDNLDAKVDAANKFIAGDADPERRWTERSWMLETRLFKG